MNEKKFSTFLKSANATPVWVVLLITIIVGLFSIGDVIWDGFQKKNLKTVGRLIVEKEKSILEIIAGNKTETANKIAGVEKTTNSKIARLDSTLENMKAFQDSLLADNATIKAKLEKAENGRYNVQSGLNASNRQLFKTLGYSDSTARALANQVALTAPKKRDALLAEIYTNAPTPQTFMDPAIAEQVQKNSADISEEKEARKNLQAQYESHVREHEELVKRTGEKFFKKK